MLSSESDRMALTRFIRQRDEAENELQQLRHEHDSTIKSIEDAIAVRLASKLPLSPCLSKWLSITAHFCTMVMHLAARL